MKKIDNFATIFFILVAIGLFALFLCGIKLRTSISEFEENKDKYTAMESELAEYKDKYNELESKLAECEDNSEPASTQPSSPISSIVPDKSDVKTSPGTVLFAVQPFLPESIPGDTYQERQRNTPEDHDINVCEVWSTTKESPIFPNKLLNIHIDNSTCIKDLNYETLHFFMHYVLYSPDEETVILEGLDDRNYFMYEFNMVNHTIKISGGQNVDVPDSSFTVVQTWGDGSFAYKDGYLGLWQFRNLLCQVKTSKPTGELFDAYGSIPYLDNNGNLIYIQYDGLKLNSITLASNVKKVIFAYDLERFYIIQNMEGKYGLILFKGTAFYSNLLLCKSSEVTQEDFSILWFDEKDISDLHFILYISGSSDKKRLSDLSVEFNIKGVKSFYMGFTITLYTPANPINVDETFSNSFEKEFSPSEFDEKYKEVLTYIQDLEANAKKT